ncbi:hypothetical protein FisN_13Hh361 [Fistulifera solaris]|uniref:Rab-GAP TBC domain-containing protein n=1 Tax=Fistulifera solaris TaxID=1519565 RepID=A0A1Z5KMJ7_FISSO|nr:hypothetical protein FisN_13Hh361 [Fistulifera solaris]|eukprot:GAX27553.1 hypothetical protein FisN_13Hh361 [Fistulifera solaris]
MTAQSRTQQWRQAFGDPLTTLSFAELSQQYPIPQEHNNKQEKETPIESPSSPSTSLDPLTAMYMQDLQQQTDLQTRQLQYRQKRRNSRRLPQEDESLTLPEQRAVSWQILQKDLHRLPDPDAVGCLAHRKQLIAQVLFVWLCHTHTEYQQGMHEVVSFLLYALEVDATETTTSSPASGDFAQTLLDFVSIILPAILPAYESSLQPLTARIIQQVQHYHPGLYPRLQGLPLQLVFCKWIRLLFAREVTDVLALWDVLFPYYSTSLLTACEALCVARLLLHRDWILETSQDDLLHWLMNVAPEESLVEWIPLFSRIVQQAPIDDLLPSTATTTNTTADNNTATNTSSSWTDPLSHAFSQLAMTPARVIHNHHHDTHNTNNNPFSAFKERWVQPSEQLLTQKIHSVSQRLFASTQPAERDYSDPGVTPFRHTSLRDDTAQQMQQALNTVAAYLMEQPHVPVPVQHAMAELQLIQQDLSRQFN